MSAAEVADDFKDFRWMIESSIISESECHRADVASPLAVAAVNLVRADSIPAMSRAFVRDPETPGPTCPSPPGCGGIGVPVSTTTLRARLRPEAAARFEEEAFFCPDPACEVAYFDGRLAWAARSELLEPAYPKQEGAPLCACFGVSREAIEELGRRGDKAAMREFLERTTSPAARCATRAADGRSCATEARRVFLRALAGGPDT
jgi:hypothetical protein